MMRPQTSINSSQSKIYENSKSFRISDPKRLRQLPQQMMQDKEFLYEENLKLKQELQEVRFELKKEKQDHANFEKTVAKTNEQQNQLQVMLQQRARIKEQKQKISELQDQVIQLKRNPERTKRLELEAMLEEMRESYQKMKMMVIQRTQSDINDTLQPALNNKNSTNLKEQLNQNLCQAYRQDNISLANQIVELQHANQQLQNQIKLMKTERDRAVARTKELDKQLETVNKHMIYMRQEVQNSKKQAPQEDLLKRLEELQEQNSIAGKMITQQKRQIEELENKCEEIQHTFDIHKSIEQKEKEKLQDRINLLKKQIDDYQYRQEESLDQSEVSIKQSGNLTSQQLNSSQQQSKQRFFPRVNQYEINDIVNRLKLQMIVKNVTFDVQDAAICDVFEEEVQLFQMIDRLQDEPFKLPTEEAKLIARYLIEDNNEEHIPFDPQRVQSKPIIKSVYKKLIGDYQLFSPKEKEELSDYFSKLFHKYQSGMESAIKQCVVKKKHLGPSNCEQEDLNEALKYCDIILSPRQKLFLDLSIFEHQGTLAKFNYQALFEQFKYFEAEEQ